MREVRQEDVLEGGAGGRDLLLVRRRLVVPGEEAGDGPDDRSGPPPVPAEEIGAAVDEAIKHMDPVPPDVAGRVPHDAK